MEQVALLHQAIILFGHGARDPQWAEPMRRLEHMLKAQHPTVRVELAFLELMQPSLPDCVEGLVLNGIDSIQVVPIFFGQGGHLKNDFPLLMQQMQETYPNVRLTATQAVGQWDAVWNTIAIEIGRLCV
jgi:sirohydrochlorin cobaltochelatase